MNCEICGATLAQDEEENGVCTNCMCLMTDM